MERYKRISIYILGLFLVTLGSVISIKSQLGVSPISSLPFSISKVSPISMGVASFVLFTFYVALQIIILRKEFNKMQLLQLVFALFYGQLVDLLNNFITLSTNNIIFKFVLCFTSIVIIGVGITLIIKANIVPLAPEGLAKAISHKTDIEFGKVKTYLDCTVVSIAILLLIVSGKGLEGIGIGTILAAVMVGKVVQLINKLMKAKEEKSMPSVSSSNLGVLEEVKDIE